MPYKICEHCKEKFYLPQYSGWWAKYKNLKTGTTEYYCSLKCLKENGRSLDKEINCGKGKDSYPGYKKPKKGR